MEKIIFLGLTSLVLSSCFADDKIRFFMGAEAGYEYGDFNKLNDYYDELRNKQIGIHSNTGIYSNGYLVGINFGFEYSPDDFFMGARAFAGINYANFTIINPFNGELDQTRGGAFEGTINFEGLIHFINKQDTKFGFFFGPGTGINTYFIKGKESVMDINSNIPIFARIGFTLLTKGKHRFDLTAIIYIEMNQNVLRRDDNLDFSDDAERNAAFQRGFISTRSSNKIMFGYKYVF